MFYRDFAFMFGFQHARNSFIFSKIRPLFFINQISPFLNGKCRFYIDLRIFTQVLLRLLPHLPPKPHPHPPPPQRGGDVWVGPRGGGAGVGDDGDGAWEVGEVADIGRLA